MGQTAFQNDLYALEKIRMTEEPWVLILKRADYSWKIFRKIIVSAPPPNRMKSNQGQEYLSEKNSWADMQK